MNIGQEFKDRFDRDMRISEGIGALKVINAIQSTFLLILQEIVGGDRKHIELLLCAIEFRLICFYRPRLRAILFSGF